MIQGVAQFQKIVFPSIDPRIWQDPNVYKDNPYWKPVSPRSRSIHPSTLQQQPGNTPSEGINHIFKNPAQYTMDCGQFVQTVKLYGMLKSMGEEEFNKYIEEQGDEFRLINHASTGVKYERVYSKVRGLWDTQIKEKKVIKNSDVGTELTLTTEALRGTNLLVNTRKDIYEKNNELGKQKFCFFEKCK